MKKSTGILLVALLAFFSCKSSGTKGDNSEISGDLIIFHAGSLSMPFKAIADTFMKIHPGVNVLAEASGSIDAARKITELNRPCDIMASADYSVIDNLLVPEFADDNIKFAANEMAIVFNDKSRYASQIDSSNWAEILMKEDVAFGRADPNSDPCGYRTLLTLKLAGVNSEKFTEKDRKFMRPKEVDLLALLDVNAVDYIFLYKSVAVQHNLRYTQLPESVNLSNPNLNDVYSKVSVQVRGAKPGETMTMNGEAMVYGVTVLRDAPNKKAAEAFIEFLLSEEGGRKILREMGQSPVYDK
ncbi:MAG: tungstate ABC transporter substrate-binding protein WtpA [Bacteroidetes bacterium HGW-Bacteroidetes-10]|nr:MAG: tungstate ABC transporter substrate-binding protein WtpA [Bacteroidetes bacterium HGW-Bacteroidetes-10]